MPWNLNSDLLYLDTEYMHLVAELVFRMLWVPDVGRIELLFYRRMPLLIFKDKVPMKDAGTE